MHKCHCQENKFEIITTETDVVAKLKAMFRDAEEAELDEDAELPKAGSLVGPKYNWFYQIEED